MFWHNPSIEKVVTYLSENTKQANDAYMLLLPEEELINIKELIKALNQCRVTFFGGIFPQIIYDNKCFKKGLIATKVTLAEKPKLIKGFDTGAIDIPQLQSSKNNTKAISFITFVDGLSTYISKYISSLYNKIGNASLIGAGAGSLSFKQKPCVICNDGIFENAAVIATVEYKCEIGSAHGWTDLRGPFVATKTKGNIIEELNWTAAFNVYKEVVDEDLKENLTLINFAEISKSYPFGIYKEGEEKIVRDPIAVTDKKGLICVGEVPENSILFLLKGKPEKIIEAAQWATGKALNNKSKTAEHVFVIDCISRSIFLNDSFNVELNNINQAFFNQKTFMKGVLSIGEIASDGKGYVDFYNKTIVVGAFYSSL